MDWAGCISYAGENDATNIDPDLTIDLVTTHID
jgi:hypothetical protein